MAEPKKPSQDQNARLNLVERELKERAKKALRDHGYGEDVVRHVDAPHRTPS